MRKRCERMRKRDQIYIKNKNKNLVLSLIQSHGMISRAEIAKLTKMSATTVSRIVSSLMEMNLVQETDQYTTGVGRKATLVTLNSKSVLSIGVELDEKTIRVGFIDFLGKLIVSESLSKKINEDPESVIAKVSEIITRLLLGHKFQTNNIIGVCIGLPGLIDNENGIVNMSTQLGWNNINLAKLAKEKLGFQVIIDNELKVKAYAETRVGKARHSNKMVMIGFGSGVGSALTIDKEIYRGNSNTAGEIGHTVVNPNGTLCTCGNFGCIQTYIAERFLLEEASKNTEVQSIEEIINFAERNEKWAVNIIERAITYAVIAINNSVCIENPDTVILTGSLIDQSNYIRERIISKCDNHIWEALKHSFVIDISELGSSGVVLGAGLLIQSNFLEQLNFENEIV